MCAILVILRRSVVLPLNPRLKSKHRKRGTHFWRKRNESLNENVSLIHGYADLCIVSLRMRGETPARF